MAAFPTKIMTNTEPDFYSLLGPFLSRREIVRETGFPIWDEDGKIWFIVLDNERVAGFAALRIRDNTADFVSAYVLPEYRGLGIHAVLVGTRLDYCRHTNITHCKSVVISAARKQLLLAGFREVGSSKNYTRMEMDL